MIGEYGAALRLPTGNNQIAAHIAQETGLAQGTLLGILGGTPRASMKTHEGNWLTSSTASPCRIFSRSGSQPFGRRIQGTARRVQRDSAHDADDYRSMAAARRTGFVESTLPIVQP